MDSTHENGKTGSYKQMHCLTFFSNYNKFYVGIIYPLTATNYFARELDKAFTTILGKKERVIQSMVKRFQVCVRKQRRHVG